ncbi:MAG: phosphoribosylformylglycinamidine synthase subunit PurL [Candidatus Hydrogenedentes bacterium]|nr:phosphoribosylformylglycinamidine synthase subunit PurL [Candidatus Hydrogenedentota bacterium]
MLNRIEVSVRPELQDPIGKNLSNQINEDLGIPCKSVRVVDVYTILAKLTEEELTKIARELFTDAVIQVYEINGHITFPEEYRFLIEVGFKPGVTDNVGKSAKEGIQDTLSRELGPEEMVFKSTLYWLAGISKAECEKISQELLANDLIQQWIVLSREELFNKKEVNLLPLPLVKTKIDTLIENISLDLSDEELLKLSEDRLLALDLNEMKAIKAYFESPETIRNRQLKNLPKYPNDIEIEILAQTWSEHCKHKIFNAEIEYIDEKGNTEHINSLFRTYIKSVTDILKNEIDWLVSVFHDNAGLIKLDDNYLLSMKVETHNSPSALDPYGGAITGIVGVNRDILGAGLGCKCIFNTDVFCFASPFYEGKIPPRLLHPKRVFRGVHAGVKDGGNQSGIPTVNGAIVFHEKFLGKPLVFCGTGGIIPSKIKGRPSHLKKANPGDLIVMVGGRIGKDGIHGATFSSQELHEGSPVTAVQIGDPITQKKFSDFLFEARDMGLYNSITDNGAGGLSSSVGEMAKDAGGAEVHLDKAPLKYHGLAPWEIFLSESQERMTLAVPPQHIDEFLSLAKKRNVEATVLGKFTDSGYLECYYEGKLIASLSMDFLHNGVPIMKLKAKITPYKTPPLTLPSKSDLTKDLIEVLSSLNVCSKEPFVRMYDHEVQAQTIIKPFQGIKCDGPGDATVLRPIYESSRGIAVACGICPKYSHIDCYQMASNAVDEAVRNLVCVGVGLKNIAGLDNFCWPDPIESEKTPDGKHKLAQLVQACKGLHDTCLAYKIPLISGKDSMKNDYKIGDTKISIPPTLLFTAIGFIENVYKTTTMDVKSPGDRIYIVGKTVESLGGSEWANLMKIEGGTIPTVMPNIAVAQYEKIHKAIENELVNSCHDCSDGGLAVALAESAFAGELGMKIDIRNLSISEDIVALFSETPSRIVVTVSPEKEKDFLNLMKGCDVFYLGEVVDNPEFVIQGTKDICIRTDIYTLKEAWQRTLRW